jgi:hypothetical protein
MPVHSDDLSDSSRHDFRAATVEINATDLRVGRRWHADVARRTDIKIEFIVAAFRIFTVQLAPAVLSSVK